MPTANCGRKGKNSKFNRLHYKEVKVYDAGSNYESNMHHI